jgi:large conductance mechanosensitive channel
MSEENEILNELKRIRELLEPKPTPQLSKGILAEFKDFLSKYKVMGLTVAFILGLYLGVLVKALVEDLIMPTLQFFMPNVVWEDITIGPFRIGHFTGALTTFLIIVLIIFLLVKIAKRWGID